MVYVERHGAYPMSPLAASRAVLKRLRIRRPSQTQWASRGRIRFVRAPLIPLHGDPMVDRLNAITLRAVLSVAVPGKLQDATALVTYPSAYVLRTLELVGFETVVYDASQRFWTVPAVYGTNARRNDEAIVRLADVCSCDSLTIVEDRAAMGRKCWRMPQGVPCGFREARDDQPAHSGDDGRVAGFVGFLGDVIDWNLITGVASLLQDFDFRFYGPHEDGSIPESLPENVHLLGPVGSDDVPAMTRTFDVGLIPYVRNERTDAVFPTKLTEYIASGVRVVSTSLPDVCALKQETGGSEIGVADGVEEFAALVVRMARLGRLPAATVKSFCTQYSWDGLVDDFVRHLEAERTRALRCSWGQPRRAEPSPRFRWCRGKSR